MIEFRPFDYTPPATDWFLQRNPICRVSDAKGIVAWRGREIQAMAIMDTWATNSCQIHIVVDNPMVFRHGFKEKVLDYIFLTCNRGIVYGLTPADNKKALRFSKHIGFEHCMNLKDGYKIGIDLVLQEIRKEKYYGKASYSRAA